MRLVGRTRRNKKKNVKGAQSLVLGQNLEDKFGTLPLHRETFDFNIIDAFVFQHTSENGLQGPPAWCETRGHAQGRQVDGTLQIPQKSATVSDERVNRELFDRRVGPEVLHQLGRSLFPYIQRPQRRRGPQEGTQGAHQAVVRTIPLCRALEFFHAPQERHKREQVLAKLNATAVKFQRLDR